MYKMVHYMSLITILTYVSYIFTFIVVISSICMIIALKTKKDKNRLLFLILVNIGYFLSNIFNIVYFFVLKEYQYVIVNITFLSTSFISLYFGFTQYKTIRKNVSVISELTNMIEDDHLSVRLIKNKDDNVIELRS